MWEETQVGFNLSGNISIRYGGLHWIAWLENGLMKKDGDSNSFVLFGDNAY